MIFENVNDFKKYVLRILVHNPHKFRTVPYVNNINASFINPNLSDYNTDKRVLDSVDFTDYGYSFYGTHNTYERITDYVDGDMHTFCISSCDTEWQEVDSYFETIFTLINQFVKEFKINNYNISVDFEYIYSSNEDMTRRELELLEKENN